MKFHRCAGCNHRIPVVYPRCGLCQDKAYAKFLAGERIKEVEAAEVAFCPLGGFSSRKRRKPSALGRRRPLPSPFVDGYTGYSYGVSTRH